MPYFPEKVLDGFALSGHEIHLPCAIGARPLVKSMDKDFPSGQQRTMGRCSHTPRRSCMRLTPEDRFPYLKQVNLCRSIQLYIYISSNESIYLHITTDTFMTSHHNMLLRTSGSFWFRQAPAAEDWWTPQRLICLTLQGIEYDDLQLWSWNRLLMGCWMIIRFIGIANVVLDDIKWYCRYHQCKKSNNKNTQWVVV
jgi:hypothetical protein